VPYYRKIFDERELKPKDIRCVNDLKKLPGLEKETFKANFAKILAKNVNTQNIHLVRTSGTSGKPLQFYQSKIELQMECAFIYHQWSQVGFKPGDRLVSWMSRLKRESYGPKKRILYLPVSISIDKKVSYHLLEKIKSFGAEFLHGCPSNLAIFANILKVNDVEIPFKLKSVFFAAEPVYDWMREVVEEVFNCRVFSHYGQTEQVALAGECEYSYFYHCLPQYGVTEIDPDTQEIIATGFLNYMNPFIRYRTTDVTSRPIFSKCNDCRRNYFPIFKTVKGRLQDIIITPDGSLRGHISLQNLNNSKTIKNTQIIQKAIDYFILRVELYNQKFGKKSDLEIKNICKELKQILGSDVQVEINIEDKIERLKSGKFQWIISEVSKSFMEKGLDRF